MSNGKDPNIFTVIGAKGLNAQSEVGIFVVVSMGNQTWFRTKSATSESPQWNDSRPIPVPGPRSFSIAIHRESPKGNILLGEIKDIIVSSGPTELMLPIEPLMGGRQIVVTASIRSLKDMSIPSDNSRYEPLVCLSNFVVKTLSGRHPDLPDSARLSVAINVEDNSLYETTAVKKEPSETHWNCNGKVILSSGRGYARMVYTLRVINETASKKSLGFVQLDSDVLEKPQDKRLRRKVVQYTNKDPGLEILFTAKVLGLSASDTLPHAGGSFVHANSGISPAKLTPRNVLVSHGNSGAVLNSNQPVISHSSSTLGDADDIIGHLITSQSDEDSSKAALLKAFGDQLLKQFQADGRRPYLDLAITNFLLAVQVLPDGHPLQFLYLQPLGMTLCYRFQQFGSSSDINDGVQYLEKSASLSSGHPHFKAISLNGIGLMYHIQFKRFGEISDLTKAISALETAVELTPEGGQKARYLCNLGDSFQHLYLKLGELSDLEKSISAFEASVKLSLTDHPSKAFCLSHLALSFKYRFERLGEIFDMEKMNYAWKHAVEITPNDHPELSTYLVGLSNSHHQRFDRLGEVSDLEKAVSVAESAVDLTPIGHPRRPKCLNILGVAYLLRFKRLEDILDLEKAIFFSKNAVELTPNGHPEKANYLSNLAHSFRQQFERQGDLASLDKAISLLENAIELTPTEIKPRNFNDLGGFYRTRFDRLGETLDLDKAISNLEKAVELTPSSLHEQPKNLSNLGISLGNRYANYGEISDLEKAVSVLENAIELIPPSHPMKLVILNNLGTLFLNWFTRLGEISHLEKAISALENAVEITPTGHPNQSLAGQLTNLGISYQYRFERLGQVSDRKKSISALENAVELIQTGHPNKAGSLISLGFTLESQYVRLGDISILEKAIHCFSQASHSSTSSPELQFRGAVSWARCTVKAGLSPIEPFHKALHLLPQVAWIGLPILDRYYHLSDISSVVHDAASAAIASGQYDLSLQWLEQGRSIVWGQLLHLRTPVDELHVKEPELAIQLLEVSKALDKASAREIDLETSTSVEQIAQNHHLLALKWDKLIKEVCLVPGFEEFLSPKTVPQLLPAAKFGPVIVITIHKGGCHALILHKAVVHIPLPNFTYEKANYMLLALKGLCRSRFIREVEFEHEGQTWTPQSSFEEILSDLWTLVVLPILISLALPVPNNNNLPHIWWCPTGPLAFLPIHAAGIYTTAEHGHKLADFAISSYTPTVTALLNTQHNSPPTAFKILAIAQASNPGQSPLPNTETELENLKRRAGQLRVESLKGAQATVDNVVQGISESTWVHLACHGTQNPANPTKSAFILANGNLELSRITKMSLPQAEFAFLSACQTAAGDVTLEEEAVHLAAGMLMAGYRSVIATMWSIMDKDGPQVADDVYAELLRNGQPDYTRAAYALHHATQNLRRRGAPFLSWVPFIHLGR